MTVSANFAAFVLLARYFGPNTLGKFVYILNFMSIAIVFVEFGTTGVVSKQLAQIQRNEAEDYWGNFLILRIFLYLILIVPILGAALLFRPDLFGFLTCCILALPFLASRFFEPVYQIYRRPWYSTVSNGCYSIAWLALTLGVLSFSSSLGWVIAAYILSNIFYTIFAFHLTSRLLRPRLRINVDYLRRFLRLSLPIGVSSIFYWLNFRISIFMLSSMQSDAAVGLFSVPFRLLEITAMIGVVLMSPLIPIFSEMAQRDRKKLKRAFSWILEIVAIAAIPIAIVAPFVTKPLIQFLFGSKFVETASTVNVVAWIGIALFLNLLFSFLNLSLGIVRYGYWNTAFALAVTAVLNYMWIPKYGYICCAWSALVSESLLLSIAIYYTLKSTGNLINFVRWSCILGANLIFFLCLHYNIFNLSNLIHIFLAAGIYITVIFLSKVVDVSDLVSVYAREKI